MIHFSQWAIHFKKQNIAKEIKDIFALDTQSGRN